MDANEFQNGRSIFFTKNVGIRSRNNGNVEIHLFQGKIFFSGFEIFSCQGPGVEKFVFYYEKNMAILG
jgi:hypothetical protein